MALAFWICLGAALWSYLGYPLLLAGLVRLRRRPIAAAEIEPTITIVVAAYNEQKHIARKLEMLLALDYPAEKREIYVASDASTDDTHAIVARYADAGVRLAVLPARGGKTSAQNLAASLATGEILIFTDATTDLDSTALRTMLRPFADARVGCVGAELEYVSEGGTAVGKGAGAYWRYERAIKRMESDLCSLVGVSGALYAVRRSAYRALEDDLCSDFVIASDVVETGHLAVYGCDAVSRELTNEDSGREFEMRVRIVIQSIHVLVKRARMLNPFRFGFFSLELFSHKVLRYLVPWLLLASFALNGALVARGVVLWLYIPTLLCHLAVFGGALAGWYAMRNGKRWPLVHIPYYFAHANAAALVGLLRYLRGERMVTWTPAR
jgi:cellulose synthase/poly-beta-1,6-N-acetylglucosamine synthase-like glycosyltransferase